MQISIERGSIFWQAHQILIGWVIVIVKHIPFRVSRTLGTRRGAAAPFSKPEKVSSYQSCISVKAVINHIVFGDVRLFCLTSAPRLLPDGLRRSSSLARS